MFEVEDVKVKVYYGDRVEIVILFKVGKGVFYDGVYFVFDNGEVCKIGIDIGVFVGGDGGVFD